MSELSVDFSILPSDYQNVLRLAQDEHGIKVTPLQELKGGRTGAYLYLVSVASGDSNRLQHFVLKLDHKSKKTNIDELQRHRKALESAPKDFAHNHIATLAFERIEKEDTIAIFYSIAGQSLQNYQSLASFQQQSKLEKIFITTNQILLTGWNTGLTFEQAVHPQKLLAKWLGYRLQSGGNIEKFLEDECSIEPNTPGLLIQGNVFPNPLLYARNPDHWGTIRPIDTIRGFQHGDLNIGNILARFNGNQDALAGYYLIDFALFKDEMPLLYDQRYLEISYLIRELSHTPFTKWVDLVTRFSEQDIIDSQQVPAELYGACAVISAGRKTFDDWVQQYYLSLSDDLWGQSRLAAVAAGLNFCNKTNISRQERLSGLIFAAAHLKRYHAAFGIPLPVEVKHLDIDDQSLESNVVRIKATRLGHNLPTQPTPFIGRQQEVTAICDHLLREEIRLLTLTGPGGTGKTRLAIKAASNLTDQFDDGIYFVDLAPARDTESVLTSIAQIIGLRVTSDRSLLDELKIQLHNSRMLILLDNFEQVMTAAATIAEFLRECTGLKIVVTSREPLRVRGEHVFPVPPLAMPGEDLKQLSTEELNQYEAIRLFVESARMVKHDFQLTSENVPLVVEICSHVDGLPLAIELAAARMNLFSLPALLKRVSDRLTLLQSGARDLPVRQKTLRDTIDWSYDLLDTGEKQLFALLSIFSGCTFEAVEAVTGQISDMGKIDLVILDGLASLVDKSLLRQVEHSSGGIRLVMLETIREYAEERLAKDPKFKANAEKAHAIYYAELTQHKRKNLIGSAREEALAEVESDIENVQSAWRYWVSKKDLDQLGKLTDCLWLLYDARGWYHATVDLTADLLNVLASSSSTPERAQQEIMLQTSLARALMAIKGYTQEVEDAYNKALELCKEYGEVPQLFPVLRALASFYVYRGNFKKGVEIGEQMLNISKRIDDVSINIEGHLIMGYNLAFIGNLNSGLEHLEKAIAGYDPNHQRSQSFRFGTNPRITGLTTSGLLLWMKGFPDKALQRIDKSIELAESLNHPFSIAYALFHSGLLHLWRGEMEMVHIRAQAVLKIAAKHEFHIWEAVATCLEGVALAGMGDAENGLIKISMGMDLYEELKTPPVFWPMLLMLRAGTCGETGRYDEGLRLLDKAIDILGESSGNPLLSELYRLKGNLLKMNSLADQTKAEEWLRKAIEIAKMREARMFELRAAISINRLWQEQGKGKQGRQLLKDVYDAMSEGFATADLKEALAMLSNFS